MPRFPRVAPPRHDLLLAVLLLGASAPTLARSTTTTTTTATAATPLATTPVAAPTTSAPARTRLFGRRARRPRNNPRAVPFNPMTGRDAPFGNLPPRVTPGRPVGALSTTPALTPADPGDTGESQTNPFTPR